MNRTRHEGSSRSLSWGNIEIPAWGVALCGLASLLLIAGCPHGERKRGVAADASAGQSVAVFKPEGRTVRVQVEVRRTPRERAQGMMFRKQLAPSAGMLFVFQETAVHPFWMKNTYIPLDMIFIGEDRKVVGIVANAEPLSETPRSVEAASRYVVEVNAGFAKSRGLAVGTPVDLYLPSSASERGPSPSSAAPR